MATILIEDLSNGLGRLLASDRDDDIILEFGALDEYPDGAWLLGGNDVFRGSSDDELVYANSGNDDIFMGDGQDTVYGGRGDDLVSGDNGNDLLRGDNENDLIEGLFGNDILYGGKESDTLFGGEGDDFLTGDRGIDSLTGGAGNDTFAISYNVDDNPDDNIDIILDFQDKSESDKILLPLGVVLEPTSLKPSQDINNDGLGDFILKLQSNQQTLAIVINNANILGGVLGVINFIS